jgi:hypothetical protein
VFVSIFGLVTGRWLWPDPMVISFHWAKIAILGTALLLGAWGYKAMMIRMGW